MKRLLLFFSLLIPVFFTQAQDITYEDRIYDPNIETVLLYKAGNQLSDPVIRLNSNDKLWLSFDDFSKETFRFKYTFIHCNEFWEPSDLRQIDYLDGYFEGEILDYHFSLNAIPGYIHYTHVLPDPDMRIKLSGNYILKVYVDNDSDENVLFTRRFFVVEPVTTIETEIPYYPKRLEYTRKKQQIDLRILTPDLFNAEPKQRISVTIQQNGRWDNAKMGIKATSVLMNELQYNFRDGIVFDGGNEFRHFDMKSFLYQSMYIRQIISTKDGYEVFLHTDYPRAKKPYETLDDINGKKLIKARQDQITMIEGEYAYVDFTLKQPEIEGADIYILGAINDWQLDDECKMTYDPRTRSYHARLFLKQGYYDYMYAVVPRGLFTGDITIIEGDNWQTRNSYTVYVYYEERVPEYDRLIGYKKFSSFEVSIK
jgi:hypothetical protein